MALTWTEDMTAQRSLRKHTEVLEEDHDDAPYERWRDDHDERMRDA